MYEYPTQHTGQTDTVTVSHESRMCESWTRLNNPLILFVCQSASQPAAKLTSEHKNPDAFQSSTTNRVNCSSSPFRFSKIDWSMSNRLERNLSFLYLLLAINISRNSIIKDDICGIPSQPFRDWKMLDYCMELITQVQSQHNHHNPVCFKFLVLCKLLILNTKSYLFIFFL